MGFAQRLKNLYDNSLYRNAIYLILNSGVPALLGFVFWILAARLYTAEAVGIASVLLSAVALLSLLASFGFGTGLIRYLPEAGGQINKLLNTVYTTNAVLAVITSIVFIIGLGFWAPGLVFVREQPAYLFAFISFTVAACLAGMTTYSFIARKRAEFALIQSAIYSINKLILVIVLAQFFAVFGIFTATGLGYVIAVSVGILIFLPWLVKGYLPLPVIQISLLKNIIKFSFSNYVAAVFEMAPALILPILILNVLGAEQAAYFFITWNIAGLMNTIGSATALSIFAEGSTNGEITTRHISQSLKFVMILLIPAIVLLILLGDKLLLIFGDAYSRDGTQLLPVLVLAAIPLSINGIYFSLKKVEKDMKPVIYFSGLISALTLGLSYLLLPEFGLVVAGIAWLASQTLVALIILLIFLKKKLAKR